MYLYIQQPRAPRWLVMALQNNSNRLSREPPTISASISTKPSGPYLDEDAQHVLEGLYHHQCCRPPVPGVSRTALPIRCGEHWELNACKASCAEIQE